MTVVNTNSLKLKMLRKMPSPPVAAYLRGGLGAVGGANEIENRLAKTVFERPTCKNDITGCRVLGMPSTWHAKYLACYVLGLLSTWPAEYLACQVLGVPSSWYANDLTCKVLGMPRTCLYLDCRASGPAGMGVGDFH